MIPAHYVLVESQGNWAGPNAGRFLQDALVLAETGRDVSVYLIQDGVLTAVGNHAVEISALVGLGVTVCADDFSVAQRAVARTSFPPGVEVTPIDWLATRLLDHSCKVVWH